MAFSYWATAMSRSTSATFRLAWLLPPSKIGREICGANFQTKAPASKSPASSSLPKPTDETRVMRGKEGRPRRTDVGVGPLELTLGLEDVGAAQQHVGRQAGGDVLQCGQ